MLDVLGEGQSYSFRSARYMTDPPLSIIRTPAIQVSLILQGSLEFKVDGELRRVHAPRATFQAFQEQLEISSISSDPVRTMWCFFTPPDMSSQTWQALRVVKPSQKIPDLLPLLFNRAMELFQDIHANAAESETLPLLNAIGSTIIAEYLHSAGKSSRPPLLPAAMRLIMKAIEEDLTHPWSLDEFSRISGFNKRYLIEIFARYTGTTPIRYLWRCRVREGMRLLQETDCSINQIACACGFQNSAHFSRAIREASGQSPRTVRLAALT